MMVLVMVFACMRMIVFLAVVFMMGKMLVRMLMMSMFVLMVMLVFVFPAHRRFSFFAGIPNKPDRGPSA